MPWAVLHDMKVDENEGARTMVARRLRLWEEGFSEEVLIDAEENNSKDEVIHRGAGQRQRDKPLEAVLMKAAEQAASGAIRTARRTLREVRVLPPTIGTKEKVVELFALGENDAWQGGGNKGRPVQTTMPHRVAARVEEMRGAAQAGPSRERNSHIQSLMVREEAQRTLANWVDDWPNLSRAIRQIWSGAFSRRHSSKSSRRLWPRGTGSALRMRWDIGSMALGNRAVLSG